MDATKAFDRVNHYKLFTILHEKGLPNIFIDLIINWYTKLHASIKWCDAFSDIFDIKSGVRQGGILSPILFNIYVDRMLNNLKRSKLGCSIFDKYIGCIMYADDLLLLSASVRDLQNMLNICCDTTSELGITFNPAKSKCLFVGPDQYVKPAKMYVNNSELVWTDNIKYLGVVFQSGKSLGIDLSECRKKFFSAVNNILSKTKFCSEIVRLHLLESYCLPILSYALESIILDKSQLRQLNSWWNSVYRTVFNYNKWDSVKELIYYLGRIDLLHIVQMRRLLFFKDCLSNFHRNCSVYNIMLNFSYRSYCAFLCHKNLIDLTWSVGSIKCTIFNNFSNIISQSQKVDFCL